MQHNQDRKHRTYVYVLTVTETLEAWEDSVNIGKLTQLYTFDLFNRFAVGLSVKHQENHSPTGHSHVVQPLIYARV